MSLIELSRKFSTREPNALLSAHDVCLELGKCDEDRQRSYRDKSKSELSATVIDQVRTATYSHYALSSQKFITELEDGLGRGVRPGKPSRPLSQVSSDICP